MIPGISLFSTLIRLGVGNCAYITWYRLHLKTGLHRRRFPVRQFTAAGAFFQPCAVSDATTSSSPPAADALLTGQLPCYGHHIRPVGNPPDWFLNPFSGNRHPGYARHWTELHDFDPVVGDIKHIWEASRFTWAPILARAYRLTNDPRHLDTLNAWLRNWCARNPVNQGPNWKCGQEASIRVMHLLLTARMLDQLAAPAPTLREFVRHHLVRIAGNIRYALAQDNNHAISETATLFAAGAWLARVGATEDERSHGTRLSARGSRLLCRALSGPRTAVPPEDQRRALVFADGGFAQYSVNYHRMVLDTLTSAIQLTRSLDVSVPPPISNAAGRMLDWLAIMTEPASGLAPNIGANDGARLFPVCDCDYQDFRPSIQTAAIVLRGSRALPPGPWDEQARWMTGKHPAPAARPQPQSDPAYLPDSGFAVLHSTRARAILRCPTRFRFRPGHADLLHLDVWLDGRPLLPDAGTFSYNCEEPWQSYFPGTAAHNTVQFDDHDQMARIGRFLFGAWPDLDVKNSLDSTPPSISAAYADWTGCHHSRNVTAMPDGFRVRDAFRGQRRKAVLRWRISPAFTWTLTGDVCACPAARIAFTATPRPMSVRIAEGWQSLYYQERTPLSVLELEFALGEHVVETVLAFAPPGS